MYEYKQRWKIDRNFLSIGVKYTSSIDTLSDYSSYIQTEYSGSYTYWGARGYCRFEEEEETKFFWEDYWKGQSGNRLSDLALEYYKTKRDRKCGNLCRKEKKHNEFCKKAMLKSNNAQKKKNFWKRKDDKYSNVISNKTFKKRYLLQLQY